MRHLIVILLSIAFNGCADIATDSGFGTSSSTLAAPPAGSDLGSGSKSSAKSSFDTSGQSASKVVLTQTQPQCTGAGCSIDSGSVQQQPQAAATDIARDDSVPHVATPTTYAAPKVKEDGKKWFTGNKKSYYLPLEGKPNVFQHFKTGTKEPSGWFYDKSTSKMVRFAGEPRFNSDSSPVFGEKDEVYNMSRVKDQKGGWKGVGNIYQDGALQKTGVDYYWGNFQGKDGIKSGWQHLYEVDPNVVGLGDGVRGKVKEGNVLMTNHPSTYSADSSQIFPASILGSLWQGGNSGVVAGAPQYGAPQSVAHQSGSTKGKLIYVSGIGCTACTDAKANAARAKGAEVLAIPMSPNIYGVTRFPSYVIDNGDGTYSPAG